VQLPGRVRGFALLCVAGVSACFSYVPRTAAELHAGEDIRVVLTDSGMARYKAQLGEAAITREGLVEGEVVGATPDAILLAVRVPGQEAGFTRALRQRVEVPRSELARVDAKRLSKGRTAAVTAGATVILGVALAHYFGGVFGGTTHPLPGGGEGELTIPILPRRP